MKRLLLAAALWWAAALSPAGHPALAAEGEPASRCGGSVHEDGSASPAQCGRRAARSARCERRAVAAGAPLVVMPWTGTAPARSDAEREARCSKRLELASLVSSVTRAPRAPPRS